MPAYIPHTYVNDGMCDYEVCCDGSDEWEGAGGVKCEDRCKTIGKEFKRLDEMRQKSARAALKKKEELVKEAQQLRAGVQMSIERLEGEIKVQEINAEELKRKYEDIERRERGRVVVSKGKGSKVTVLAGLAKQRVEELRVALLSVVGKRDALKEKVEQLEGILSTFKEEYNPNFNDEGVKRAVQAWENYAANKDPADEDTSAEDRDIEDISKPDTESEGINWTEYETEEESDVDAREFTLFPYCQVLADVCESVQIRRVPPRPCPGLGPSEDHRPSHHARRERDPSRQRQLRQRIQSRERRTIRLPNRQRRSRNQAIHSQRTSKRSHKGLRR